MWVQNLITAPYEAGAHGLVQKPSFQLRENSETAMFSDPTPSNLAQKYYMMQLISWRWIQKLSSECLYLPTNPFDITTQNTIMSTITAKRTLNLIKVANMAVKDFVYLGSNQSTNASQRGE
jgi:hypothetical protein